MRERGVEILEKLCMSEPDLSDAEGAVELIMKQDN